MICIPEFGHDAQVFTLDDSFLNAFVDGGTNFLLVLVQDGAIKETVSVVDSMLDGELYFREFSDPRTKADGGKHSFTCIVLILGIHGQWSLSFCFLLFKVVSSMISVLQHLNL